MGSSISLLISVFSIRDFIPFFEQYNRLKSPRSSFPFFKRIRITAVVTDVARLEHAETITRYRFLPRTLPCSFPLAFPLLFEWFGFYRSLVKACFHRPPPHPPTLDFLHSCTHRQWALFTKDSVLAVVLMPFQAICTFVASFPIPSPAPIPPLPPTYTAVPTSLWFHYSSCIDRAECLSPFCARNILDEMKVWDTTLFTLWTYTKFLKQPIERSPSWESKVVQVDRIFSF